MGLLLSRFRKKKSTIQLLDDIETRIKSIEKFQKETEQKFRRVIGKLIVSSILFYAITLCGYYYYFSPDTFRENILKFLPLLVFPIVIVMSRKILSWYYRRKLSKNETTLKILKTNKKKILDEVMEKEIYKVAKEILEKYAPEQLNVNPEKNLTSNGNSKAHVLASQTPRNDSMPRQRLISSSVAKKFDAVAPSPLSGMPSENVPRTIGRAQPRLSLPRPILPRDRGPFDKLVDMIIGDGPGNRYALICRMCSSHNGMALKHEFEYLSFRCVYCMQWNPARKQKPQAPNLATDAASHYEYDANNSESENVECAKKGSESPEINDTSLNCESPDDVRAISEESDVPSDTSNLCDTSAISDAEVDNTCIENCCSPPSDVGLSEMGTVLDDDEELGPANEEAPPSSASVEHSSNAKSNVESADAASS